MRDKRHAVFRLFHDRLSRERQSAACQFQERQRGPGNVAWPDEVPVPADFAPLVTVVERTETGYNEQQPEVARLCSLCRSSERYRWVKVAGTHDADFVQQVADCFSLHPLMVEDITTRRPSA